MAEYRKEITADAHRILKDGRLLSSDEILGLLNGYEVANNLLADERDSLQSQLEAYKAQCERLEAEKEYNRWLGGSVTNVDGLQADAIEKAADDLTQIICKGGRTLIRYEDLISYAARLRQQAKEAPDGH